MKTRVRILSALLVLTLVIAARADTLNFLCDKAVDPASLLSAPAAVNSEEGKAELDFLVALQKQRTPEQVARCRTEMNLNMARFQGVLGPWLTPANLPALDALSQKIDKDVGHFIGAAKTHFNRPRPAKADSRIICAIPIDDSLAYPSGHSTWATVHALLLAELAPSTAPNCWRGAGRLVGIATWPGSITTATSWPGGFSARPCGRPCSRIRSSGTNLPRSKWNTATLRGARPSERLAAAAGDEPLSRWPRQGSRRDALCPGKSSGTRREGLYIRKA